MAKLFDRETGKIFGRLNIIDAIIIFIISLVILGAIYKINSSHTQINQDTKIIYYKIKISDIKSSSKKFFRPGMLVRDSKTKIILGNIVNCEAHDFYDYVQKTSGEINLAKKSDKIELVLTLKAHAIENDCAYLINGVYELKPAADIYIMTKFCDMVGSVGDIF